ncbi:motility associated factor glycosyltransferase family protein [Marinibaculum pumilum]|uniref:Motility associated factor glycosyltransferase family protein n=1 Tax=Marinibaculum pumilum TaxID=1766165 RepID=A0ABV7L454_9PROT
MADRARSLAAIRQRFPVLADKLAEPIANLVPILDGETLIDVSLDGKRFYGADGRESTRRQLDAYLASPHRFALGSPDSMGLSSPLSKRMTRHMLALTRANQAEEVPVYPLRGKTFLFVYGVGLGHGLERLVAETEASFVLFIEPMVQVLAHSLEVVDWEALLDSVETRGGVVDFVTLDDPKAIQSMVEIFVERNGPGFLDGSFIFQHHGLWSLNEAKKLLQEKIHEMFLAIGYFEDEMVMIRNTAGNFIGRSGGLIDGQPRVERPEPVFIVGSGPSLDEAVPVVRELRDRAIVVSCGTALSVLLRQGITPDYHVELENVPVVFDLMRRIGSEFDLSQVHFIGSTSCDPRIADLFGKADFFLRDAISSSKVFRGRLKELFGVAPTCVNSGLSCFSILGFRTFYLFGVDCGKRVDKRHHAKGSIYFDLGMGDDRFRYPLKVRANFGGDAQTSWALDLSRMMLTQVIKNRVITVFNCSDGAIVEETIPRLPTSVRLHNPPLDRPALLAEIQRRMAPYTGDDLIRAANLPGFLGDCRDLTDGVSQILRDCADADEPFSESFARMHILLMKAQALHQGAFATMGGSIRALARVGMYFGSRASDPATSRAIYTLYREEADRIMRHMMREMRFVIQEIGLTVDDVLTDADEAVALTGS